MLRFPARPVAARQRITVAVAVVVGAALTGVVFAAMVAVTLQPTFTTLEQSAIGLVPPGWRRQPPVEVLRPTGAFDRRYVVTFTPAGRVPAAQLLQQARRGGWRQVPSADVDPGTALRLQRDGVLATVTHPNTITTQVSAAVRTYQRMGIASVGTAAAIAAAAVLWRRWQRTPRLL